MSQAFDERELLERVDNDWEFLAETVQMLADDGPALMRRDPQRRWPPATRRPSAAPPTRSRG